MNNKIKILKFFTVLLFLFSLNVNSMTDKRTPKVIKYEVLDDLDSMVELNLDSESGEFKCSSKCESKLKSTSHALDHLKKIHKVKNYKIIYDDGTVKYKQVGSPFDNRPITLLTLSTTSTSSNKNTKRKRTQNEKPVKKLLKTSNDDSIDSTNPKDTNDNDDDDNEPLLTSTSTNSLSYSSSSKSSSFKSVKVRKKSDIMTLVAIDNNKYDINKEINPNYQKVVRMTREKLPSGNLTSFKCDVCNPLGLPKGKLGICKIKRDAQVHLKNIHKADEIKEITFTDSLEPKNQTNISSPLFTSTSSSLSSLSSSSSFTSSSSSSSSSSTTKLSLLLATTRNLQKQNISLSSTPAVSSRSSTGTFDAILKVKEIESHTDTEIEIFNNNIFTFTSLNLKLDAESKETEILPQNGLKVKKHSSFTISLRDFNGKIIGTMRFENQIKSITLINLN